MVDNRAVVIGPGIVGIKFDKAVKVNKGLVVGRGFHFKQRAVEDCGLIDGVELYRVIEVGHCAEEVVELIAQVRAVDIQSRLAGLQADGLVHVGSGTLKITVAVDGDVRAHDIGVYSVFIDAQRLVYVGHCGSGIGPLEV